MRPNSDSHFSHAGNLGGTTVKMTIDENSLVHLMSVLTNLYSDPRKAVIREYSTNAWDSHIAAGKTDTPIEVSLPNAMSPFFIVRDYGTGLSVDDLTNIYSKYGYSTKRHTDDEAGMLGLGSKSGLTYCDQFTLTAVKNGVKTIAVIGRGEDGSGNIDIVDTFSTNEPNGVEVKLPVKRMDTMTFCQTARDFFRFWNPDHVLVDGVAPELPEGIWPADDIFVSKNISTDHVVMGDIAYPVDNFNHSLSGNLPYGYHVVAWVGMGDVNFTPAREGLHYTPRTTAKIADIVMRMRAGIKKAATAEIATASDHPEALRIANQWRPLLRNAGVTLEYKGEKIPVSLSVPYGGTDAAPSPYVYTPSRYNRRTSPQRSFEYETLQDSLQVTGFVNKAVSTSIRKKIDKFFEDAGESPRTVVFTRDKLGDKWVSDDRVVSYEDIKAIKLPRAANGKSASTGDKFDVYRGSWAAETDPQDTNFVIFTTAMEGVNAKVIYDLLGRPVVALNRNRWDKFIREHPGAESVTDASATERDRVAATFNAHELLSAAHREYEWEAFKDLDESEVSDPELKEAIKTMALPVDRDKVRRYHVLVNLHNKSRGYNSSYSKLDVPSAEALLDKYPFLNYAGSVENAHVIEYVNAIYGTKDNA